ncbi:MAG: hypothetical protein ACKOXB_07060 [Flavobacteriales bacterium]
MIRIIKQIFRTWLITYWKLVALTVAISLTGAFIHYSIEKQTRHYSGNIVGCTLLLNHHTLSFYLFPLIDNVKKGNYEEAAAFIGLQASDLKNLKDIYIKSVAQVTEEVEVRYEFSIGAEMENDTTGLFKIETAVLNMIKKHELIASLKKNSDWAYLESKNIMEKELLRLDSLLSTVNDIQVKEALHKRKAEIKIQMVNFETVKRKIFDVKLIQHFQSSVIEEQVQFKDFLLVWLEISLILSLFLVTFLDKELRTILYL